MVATYAKKIVHNMICVTCVHSVAIINMFFAGQVSGLGKNFNIVMLSDTMNMINVKLCMVVVLIELYPFIPLSVTLIAFQGHSCFKQCKIFLSS